MSNLRRRAGVLVLAVSTVSGAVVPLVAQPAAAAGPAGPTGLAVDQARNASGAPDGEDIALSWSPVAGATGYDVQLSASPDWSDTSSITISSAHVTDPAYVPPVDLPHATYFWRVRADSSFGRSGWTSGGPLVRAWNDRPVDLASNSLKWMDLSWSPMAGASYYEIEISTNPSFPDPAPVQGTNVDSPSDGVRCYTANPYWSPYVDQVGKSGVNVDCDPVRATFTYGQTYYWRVRGRNGTEAKPGSYNTAGDAQCTGVWHNPPVSGIPATPECSLWSADGPAITPAGNPVSADVRSIPAPGDLSDSCGPDSCVNTPILSWSEVPGADFYRVTIARDPAMTNITHIVDVNDDRYLESTAEPDQQQSLYWTVQSCVFSSASTGAGTDSTVSSAPFDCGTAAAPVSYPTKRSLPVLLGTPANAASVNTLYPTLTWQDYVDAARGSGPEARDYRVQVATDPNFTDVVDDHVTDLTSYTAQKVYPDTMLWWRVRAMDQLGHPLTWSAPSWFAFGGRIPDVTSDVDSASPLLHEQWRVVRTNYASGSAYAVSASAGDRITFTVTSSSVRLFATKLPTGGYGDVYVDGAKRARVSFFGTRTAYRQSVFSASLGAGSHQMTVVVDGSHPRGSTGNAVAVDAVTAGSSTLQESAAVQRWATHRATDATHGSYLAETGFTYSRTAGANPRLWARVYGSQVNVYACRTPDSGRMGVWIDGHFAGTVDLWQSYTSCDRRVFAKSTLTTGTHTVVVEPLGTARAGAGGTRVGIDEISAT